MARKRRHHDCVHIRRQADAQADFVFLVNEAPRVRIASERTDGVA